MSDNPLLESEILGKKRKKGGLSPTQRTLRAQRDRGLVCAIVEKWNMHAGPFGIRQDLFGIIDVRGRATRRITGPVDVVNRVLEEGLDLQVLVPGVDELTARLELGDHTDEVRARRRPAVRR